MLILQHSEKILWQFYPRKEKIDELQKTYLMA